MASSTSKSKTRGTGEKARASKAKASKKVRAARPTTLSFIREAIAKQSEILSKLVKGAKVVVGAEDDIYAYSAEYVQAAIDQQLAIIAKARPNATDLRNACQLVYKTGQRVAAGEATFSVGGKDRKVSAATMKSLQAAAQQVWQAARRVEQGKARFEKN